MREFIGLSPFLTAFMVFMTVMLIYAGISIFIMFICDMQVSNDKENVKKELSEEERQKKETKETIISFIIFFICIVIDFLISLNVYRYQYNYCLAMENAENIEINRTVEDFKVKEISVMNNLIISNEEGLAITIPLDVLTTNDFETETDFLVKKSDVLDFLAYGDIKVSLKSDKSIKEPVFKYIKKNNEKKWDANGKKHLKDTKTYSAELIVTEEEYKRLVIYKEQ